MKWISSILSVLITISGQAQSFTEVLTKEGRFEVKGHQNTVMIANINGSITVEGWSGDHVVVEAKKSIWSKTAERLAQGKSEVQIGVIDRADTLIYYVTGTCHEFGRNHSRKWYNQDWRYQWDDHPCEPSFDYKMDFMVKVPQGVNVIVSTVNDGDVIVRNTRSKVVANNVNGSITLNQLVQSSSASTINGTVDVEFEKNPVEDCRFYSLNGDVNAWFQKGLAANMSFESFNGDLYTNVPELESLPLQVQMEKTANGAKYKVSGQRYRIGRGGPMLVFETMNGNVYIKEK